jgi:hypothetical protein
MWDERDCGDKRSSAADVLSSRLIVGLIMLGVAAGAGLQLFMTDTSARITPAGRDAPAPGEKPMVLDAVGARGR